MKARHPSEEGLRSLVHDTPAKPHTALDARLARYQADLDSIPPPPPAIEERRSKFVEQRLTDTEGRVSRSGSWDLELLLGEQKSFFERAYAARVVEERAEYEKRRADELQAEKDRRIKRQDAIIDAVIKAVAVFAVLGVISFLIRLAMNK